ncbi:MAG: hypothetical protein IJ168_05180 [Eubacterium sp.]|nr:hypothetical protein [Eubacterium sp.]
MRLSKKKYDTPWAEVELFTMTDIIRTSGSQDDYDEEDDDDPWGSNGTNGVNDSAF